MFIGHSSDKKSIQLTKVKPTNEKLTTTLAVEICYEHGLSPIESAKVKYNYSNGMLLHDFVFDGNNNACHTFHHFQVFVVGEKCMTLS